MGSHLPSEDIRDSDTILRPLFKRGATLTKLPLVLVQGVHTHVRPEVEQVLVTELVQEKAKTHHLVPRGGGQETDKLAKGCTSSPC